MNWKITVTECKGFFQDNRCGIMAILSCLCGWSEAGFTWPDWMEKRWYRGKVVCSSNLYSCKVGTGMCYLNFTLLPPNIKPTLWPSVRWNLSQSGLRKCVTTAARRVIIGIGCLANGGASCYWSMCNVASRSVCKAWEFFVIIYSSAWITKALKR